ncbi:UDP-glucose 4-epimerase [Triplophysa tibetana]|uniref:Cytospin-A n=1 Tax=Triplophysa tibetana TaxID=1572043 RepID=A0A5A9NSF6_9TELE|nr:UDP-glucose 4-epimerase [Triplophysa tibetana]
MKEELRCCKGKIQAERAEWKQFQDDLKVALVVSDRLREEAEEELSVLNSARQDWDRQLTEALEGKQNLEGQLKSLKIELEQSRQKTKLVTSNHQGAPPLRALEKSADKGNVDRYGKGIESTEKRIEEQLWTDELKRKREMNVSGSTERSRLPSDYPAVVVNGTSHRSVTGTTDSDIKEDNLILQTATSSVLDGPNMVNRRTQEDFSPALRFLRLHGGSKRNSLLRWCQGRTQGYKNVEITNFSSSWVDGLAFCAIYHSYLPSHIPYNTLSPENKKENLDLAFRTGEGFGISASLTVDEMLKDDAPDWHRVLEYVEGLNMRQKILVTGGGGYIGSHCVVELIEAGYHPVVIDNFSNAVREGDVPESLKRVEKFLDTQIEFHELDLLDKPGLEKIFKKHSFDAVMHFAGLKAVGESVEQPLRYYRVNLTGTIHLLEVMQSHGVRNLVFSSSATVYGDPQKLPIDEQHPVGGCTNPYGKTKYFIEEMIRDQCTANKDWNAVLLRYFNPIGAHISGQIGEDPQGIPNNLLPYVAQVAIGRRNFLNVFGNDYNTPDGTGVRDYIHVVDLAKGHIAALRKLKDSCGCKVYNLGTGTGYSVLEMVKAMEKASGRKIAYQIAPRRSGDIASCYADPSLAEKELSWKAEYDLERMCEDLWRWQSKNPTGFSNGTVP